MANFAETKALTFDLFGTILDLGGSLMPFHASFVGQIDEVRVWNIVRTEADIRSDMITQLNGDEPGLVGYWKFDEDKDGVVADVSPNRNHGNLVGNAKLIDYVRPVSAITGPDQLAKVASAYEKLLTRNTNFYDAFRYLAEIYIKTKRFSDAEKVYIRALKADFTQSEHNDAILALQKLYTDREAGEEFITLLEELKPKMEGSSVLHELLGDAYKNAGEEEKAQLAYTQWINIRKKEVELQNRASEYHILAEKLLTRDIFPAVTLELAMNALENEERSSYEVTLAHALLMTAPKAKALGFFSSFSVLNFGRWASFAYCDMLLGFYRVFVWLFQRIENSPSDLINLSNVEVAPARGAATGFLLSPN